LLMWVQNKTAGYKDVEVTNFKKSFQDGLALCAIIHKHRPQMINFASLSKENKNQNLQIAIDAAEKYFALEKYLTPDDIPKLDENSMVIYVSDYYYGIAEQRKVDIAAVRIGKVILYTQENDAKKKEYTQLSKNLRSHIDTGKKMLEDRTIDNTMAGATRRLDAFHGYKIKDKSEIIGDILTAEGIYSFLSKRLAQKKRPAFQPAAGCTVVDFTKDGEYLEKLEQEQNVALHAEVNRQVKLVQLNEQHAAKYAQLKSWIAAKDAYLKKKDTINSVSTADLHLKILASYEKENKAVYDTTITEFKALGSELLSNKFEKSSEVKDRETEVDGGCSSLAKLCSAKKASLEQDRSEIDKMTKDFADLANPLSKWITEQKDAITHSNKELEDQLKFVESRISTKDKDGSKLPTVKEMDKKLVARGITDNSYSNLSALDVDVQWQQYCLLLDKKRLLLQEDIEYKKLRGITAETNQEIEENFQRFDADHSGNINRKELTACLYSLGEEKSRSEIDAIMKEYGNSKGSIDYARFFDFMVVVYGDTDTKDAIVNGFKLINRGQEVATLDKMERVMQPKDISYITSTAPKSGNGYDFQKWCDDIFSR